MTDSLLEFPSEFPVKVVGLHSDGLRPAVEDVAEKAGLELKSVTERPSRGGRYLSLTVIVAAQTREQLDALYEGFTQLEDVKWVL